LIDGTAQDVEVERIKEEYKNGKIDIESRNFLIKKLRELNLT
jgi:hypothetical protein